ncbi:MAG: metallopeptidase TldD-related protein [Candidatus Wallbacteria bacterium]
MNIEKIKRQIKQTSVNIVSTKIDSISRKDISRNALRVYSGGFIGVAGAVGNCDFSKLEKNAAANLDYKISYPYELSSCRKQVNLTDEIISESALADEVDELLGILRKERSDFLFSNNVKICQYLEEMSNDRGLDLSYHVRYIEAGLIFKHKSSVNILDGAVGFQGRKYNRKSFVNFINEICTAYNNPVKLPDSKLHKVAFMSDDGQFLSKLVNDLNGRAYVNGASLFSDKIGHKLFNEKFTFYQSNDPYEKITSFFDDEGVINEDYLYPLIKDGVLKTPYTDKKYSSLYKLEHTASACCDYDSVPKIGFSGYKIQESSNTLKELLNGEPAVLVWMASGGDYTENGDFAMPVQLAFLHDGEKFIGRLPQIQVSSNIFKMFGCDYIGTSSDNIFDLLNDKMVVCRMDVSQI